MRGDYEYLMCVCVCDACVYTARRKCHRPARPPRRLRRMRRAVRAHTHQQHTGELNFCVCARARAPHGCRAHMNLCARSMSMKRRRVRTTHHHTHTTDRQRGGWRAVVWPGPYTSFVHVKLCSRRVSPAPARIRTLQHTNTF